MAARKAAITTWHEEYQAHGEGEGGACEGAQEYQVYGEGVKWA